MKKALITGASSGIGEEIAKILSSMGYYTILVARREDRLCNLSSSLPFESTIRVKDLTKKQDIIDLYNEFPHIDILVNSAGMGVFGSFFQTDINKEEALLKLNIGAVHLLTKLYLQEFRKRNEGNILNISSSGAFFAGPLFSSYYASKSYVLSLSLALSEELKREKSRVKISVFCPGPVDTPFNEIMGVNAGKGKISAEKAAKKAVEGMFKGKRLIIPTLTTKLTYVLSRILPESILTPIVYRMQKAKERHT